MYLHQKDSPAASIPVTDHFFIILGTYLFAVFLFKPPVLLSTKHKQGHCHTQTHRHNSNDDGDWRCYFHQILQGNSLYPHYLCFMLVEIPPVCENLLISINGTSIYLGPYARNVKAIPGTLSVPQNPYPNQSVINYSGISLENLS